MRLPLLPACALFCACTGAGLPGLSHRDPEPEPVFDRAACGRAPLPLWMDLTEPEIRALRGREKAAAGDPDALLDLAILGSGDRRAAAEYQAIHARVDSFMAKVGPRVQAETATWKKGYVLHRAMHAEFFAGAANVPADGREAMPGYDFYQSRLAGIFADGKYNCISSSILYVVLARRCGMRVKGVLLSSHAFVQVEPADGNGRIIEVETTTPTGYDWVHDEEFYRSRAKGWFSRRGLASSSFADYRNRKLVDPLALIAFNMHNQHTMASRMAPRDRNRLMEARAFLAPDDRDAQSNRLSVYNAEFLYLKGKKDLATVDRMYRAVLPLTDLSRRWGRGKGDGEMANRIAWRYFEYALALRELGRGQEALPWIDSSLAVLDPGHQASQGPALLGNNLGTVGLINADLAEAGRYEAAEANFLRYSGYAREHKDFRAYLQWFYGKWATRLWNAGEWEAVVRKLDRQAEYSGAGERKTIQDNIAIVYHNWANTLENQGDWPKARDVLRKCLERFPGEKQCRTRLERVAEQHQLD